MIRWHADDPDQEWYGWTDEQDMRSDDARFLVMSPEPGVWAGWELEPEGRGRWCITNDFETASQARAAVQGVVEDATR